MLSFILKVLYVYIVSHLSQNCLFTPWKGKWLYYIQQILGAGVDACEWERVSKERGWGWRNCNKIKLKSNLNLTDCEVGEEKSKNFRKIHFLKQHFYGLIQTSYVLLLYFFSLQLNQRSRKLYYALLRVDIKVYLCFKFCTNFMPDLFYPNIIRIEIYSRRVSVTMTEALRVLDFHIGITL